MKRFNKLVEKVLLGKYGIEWSNNAEGYAVIHTSKVNTGMEIEYYIKRESLYTDPMPIYELLGILEYELDNYIEIVNRMFLLGFAFSKKDYLYVCDVVSSALAEAIDIVRAEINRIQEGG